MVLSGVSGWLDEFVYFGLSVVAVAWGWVVLLQLFSWWFTCFVWRRLWVLSGWYCGGGFGRVDCVAGLFGYLWYCGPLVFVL